MVNKVSLVLLASLTTALLAIILDFFIHLTLTIEMENAGYFGTKFILFFIVAFIFFLLFKPTFFKIIILAIIASGLFGIYYNILPAIFDFTPFGIPLSELRFIGLEESGIILTGFLFGLTHIISVIIGASVGSLFIVFGRQNN